MLLKGLRLSVLPDESTSGMPAIWGPKNVQELTFFKKKDLIFRNTKLTVE